MRRVRTLSGGGEGFHTEAQFLSLCPIFVFGITVICRYPSWPDMSLLRNPSSSSQLDAFTFCASALGFLRSL